jgi:Uma2 family endonuclease
MTFESRHMTVDEFKRFVLLPENDDHLYEYIAGEVIEKQAAFYSALITTEITAPIVGFVHDRDLGFVTGAACYCAVLDDWYLPAAAFMSRERMAKPSQEYFVSIPPNLVVEVVSPLNHPSVLRIKLWNYQAAGIVVWVVDPDRKHVEVGVPGQPINAIGVDGTLDGGTLLPGFTLPVKDIFPE